MTALTKERDTPKRDSHRYGIPVAAGQKIFAGSLVVTNAAGYAEKGTTALAKIATGRAMTTVDNTNGAAGDQTVVVERGCFRYTNDGTITRANIGAAAYIVDDQTVAAANGGGTRSAAGTIRDVDNVGVWVEM